jgi:hypothetical protein
MKFLDLMRADGDLDIWINFDHVKYFHRAGNGTKIYLSGEPHDECEVVYDSPERICTLLKKMSSAPEMKTSENPVCTPALLSIRESTSSDEGNTDPFVFEVNGQPYLRGTLTECINARQNYVRLCADLGKSVVIVGLPEPHQSNFDSFEANPVMGQGVNPCQ